MSLPDAPPINELISSNSYDEEELFFDKAVQWLETHYQKGHGTSKIRYGFCTMIANVIARQTSKLDFTYAVQLSDTVVPRYKGRLNVNYNKGPLTPGQIKSAFKNKRLIVESKNRKNVYLRSECCKQLGIPIAAADVERDNELKSNQSSETSEDDGAHSSVNDGNDKTTNEPEPIESQHISHMQHSGPSRGEKRFRSSVDNFIQGPSHNLTPSSPGEIMLMQHNEKLAKELTLMTAAYEGTQKQLCDLQEKLCDVQRYCFHLHCYGMY